MHRKKEYIWCQVQVMNGNKEWYCVSRVLREALMAERKNNPYWKSKLIGCYMNVARSQYRYGRARIEAVKVIKIRIFHHRANDWHWTRNQFVTADHLRNFGDAYHYLKHDYAWYNRFSIWHSLYYWHVELEKKNLKKARKRLNKIRGRYFFRN